MENEANEKPASIVDAIGRGYLQPTIEDNRSVPVPEDRSRVLAYPEPQRDGNDGTDEGCPDARIVGGAFRIYTLGTD